MAAPTTRHQSGGAVHSKTSGLAIASLVLGILWLYWIGTILAVIFGHVALSRIKRSSGQLRGRGLAIAGLVFGYLGVATLVFAILVVIFDNGSGGGAYFG
jgi:hypothetical protein